MTECGMADKATNPPVIRVFGKHDITLHINDGCMGGGEGNIPHKDKMSESYADDEIFSNTGSHYSTDFTTSRHGKFHYCIFADLGWLHDWNTWHGGQGEVGGDTFIVFQGDISSSDDTAKVFMHELGHNLDLNHCSDSDCCMQSDARDGDVNYCSDCWSDLDLPGSF